MRRSQSLRRQPHRLTYRSLVNPDERETASQVVQPQDRRAHLEEMLQYLREETQALQDELEAMRLDEPRFEPDDDECRQDARMDVGANRFDLQEFEPHRDVRRRSDFDVRQHSYHRDFCPHQVDSRDCNVCERLDLQDFKPCQYDRGAFDASHRLNLPDF